MQILQNYIDGKLQTPISGKYLDNIEPATGIVYSQVPDSNEADIDVAVSAAQRAFPLWSKTDITTRSKYLQKIADLIELNFEKFSEAESMDSGKPVKLARNLDIPRAASNFSFFASAISQFSSEAHINSNTTIDYTLRSPIGVVGCISPWNLPLYLFTWKIAPALAAGNCVIAKPSEVTPYTAYLLSEICIEAGLPAGVLNIIHGSGSNTGATIVKHPAIKAISFTGSTRAGKEIAGVAAPMFKKLSLELGGKNPVLIFADCDYEKMLETTIRSSFTNQGQICLCGSRIYVEANIYEKFKKDFVQKTKQLSIGDPKSEENIIGSIVSEQHFLKIMSYFSLAQEEGGTILCGGNQFQLQGRCANGRFIEPTVIEGLPVSCRTNQEEIFGPVVTIYPFHTEEQAIEMANATEYGLASIIWTQNLSRAHRVAANIESGIVWINCWLVRDLRTPFGGVKNSGVGREGGLEALRFFTETKNVTINLT
ncbi:MAG: aldehyde dehydrogenase [Fimbriimonadaceae bacterium]|nr:aldehyde dehydrogenase [Chitinophagales bacterium]